MVYGLTFEVQVNMGKVCQLNHSKAFEFAELSLENNNYPSTKPISANLSFIELLNTSQSNGKNNNFGMQRGPV